MINVRSLDILLRTLDGDAGLGPRAATPVAPVSAPLRVGGQVDVASALLPGLALARADMAPPSTLVALSGADAEPAASSPSGRAGITAMNGANPGPAIGRDAAIVATVPPEASAPLRLSDAAVLVGQLVRDADSLATPAIRPSLPLVPTGVATADSLAHALSTSIANSGLFYESHLAQWALQQHPQSALAGEPQAGWMGQAAAAGQGVAQALGSDAAPLMQQSAGNHADAALPLVRHQLNALETRQVAWLGELWPGQRAEIHIAEEERGADAAADVPWSTRLSLHLPHLGQLDATLSLQGDTIRLRLHAQDDSTAETLQATRQQLAAAFSQRSLSLVGFSVDQQPRP